MPPVADSIALLANNPNAQNDVNVGGEGAGPLSQVLAISTVATARPNAGTSKVFSALGSETIDLQQLPSHQHLFVGLLDPSGTSGFDTLRFRLMVEGAVVIDQTFSDLNGAMGYFDDHSLDLGGIDAGVVGPLDVSWQLDMNAVRG